VLLDRTGAPDPAWFHAAKYLCETHSMLSNKNLPDSMTPRQFRTGVTTDISPWLQFQFYQAILHLDNETSWPSSKERSGYWLGISENIGDVLTYWILDDQAKQVLSRSVVRPHNRNRGVKWDPIVARRPVRETAHHGGDTVPAASTINKQMSSLEDGYDKQEPNPEPHFFDPQTIPNDVIPKDHNSEARPKDSDPATSNDEEELKSTLLDTSLPPFVPATPDQHAGDSPLRFSREQLPVDPEILCVPRLGKLPHSDIQHTRDYTPEEHPDNTEFVPSDAVPPAPPEDRPAPHAVDPAPINPDVDLRSSTRSKNQPDRFAGNRQTMWKAGKAFKSYAAVAAALGVLLLPTVIMAEPMAGLVDLGTAHHARLDMLDDKFIGDPEKADWQAEFIERCITKPRGDGSKEIIFEVQWLGGEKSWVKMDDLGTHDPFLVARCGLRGKLLEKPGWEWAELHLNSDTEITSMIRACKMSTETACKFGVHAPHRNPGRPN
jgi:hypothetical protein